MLKITNHCGSANQNHDEVLLHPSDDGCYQTEEDQQTLMRMQRKKGSDPGRGMQHSHYEHAKDALPTGHKTSMFSGDPNMSRSMKEMKSSFKEMFAHPVYCSMIPNSLDDQPKRFPTD